MLLHLTFRTVSLLPVSSREHNELNHTGLRHVLLPIDIWFLSLRQVRCRGAAWLHTEPKRWIYGLTQS